MVFRHEFVFLHVGCDVESDAHVVSIDRPLGRLNSLLDGHFEKWPFRGGQVAKLRWITAGSIERPKSLLTSVLSSQKARDHFMQIV